MPGRYAVPQHPRGYSGSGAPDRHMEIGEEAIEEFMALWHKTYGETIDKERARLYAGQLLRLLNAVYGSR